MGKPKNFALNKRLFILTFSIVFLIVVYLLFLFWVRGHIRQYIYNDIDKQLLIVAESIQLILPADYHLRAKTAAAITPEEYQQVEAKLNRLAAKSGAKYVWTDILIDNQVHLTSCNRTAGPDQQEAEIYYFMPYKNGVSEAQMKAFTSGVPVFTTFKDIWGHFRAVFVPVKNSDGSIYLACAEFTVDYVEEIVRRSNYFFLIGLTAFSLGVFPLSLFYVTSSRKNRRLLENKNDQLQQSREHLQATLRSIGDGVITTDVQGIIRHINPVAEKLTGWRAVDAVGKPHGDVLQFFSCTEVPTPLSLVEQVLAAKKALNSDRDICLLTREKRRVEVLGSAAPIGGEEAESIKGVVLVLRDVTERNKLNEKLNAGRKMEAIGVLASGIAHDFNNMLGGIIGAAELLNLYLPEDPKVNRMNKIILDSATRAAALAKQLLSFSRKSTGVAQVIDIHKLIEETTLLLRSSIDKRIEVNTDLAATRHNTAGDPSLLQNSILNLGINAAHAMPEGGLIHISTDLVDVDALTSEASPFELQPGKYIEIAVRDTGSGIPKEHIDRIFEPFFTTKAQGKGTGLGLASVYGTVKQHHGSVMAYSEVGEGTIFKILLPLSTSETVASPEAEVVAGSGHILLVDDDETMRNMAKTVLEQLGYQVRIAANGAEGVAVFRQEKETIDLVIVDMMMPVMNGRECFERIRAIDPDACVVLASGFSNGEDVDKMKKAGLKGFIQKPYFSAALSQVVHGALQDKPKK